MVTPTVCIPLPWDANETYHIAKDCWVTPKDHTHWMLLIATTNQTTTTL